MRLASIALTTVWAGSLFGQARAFDAVSVRMAGGPGSFSSVARRAGAQLTWTTTMRPLVTYAYDTRDWRVSGLSPGGMVFYTITATMSPSATEADVRAMLRTVLADRFQFAAHTATEERAGFALVIGPKGHKLAMKQGEGLPPMPPYLAGKPPEAFEGHIFTSIEGRGTSAITGRGVPLSQLAAEISDAVGAFVVDRTGLAGDYYFGFRFLDDDTKGVNARDPEVLSLPIADALRDELGLRLEKTKGPVELLVVDRVRKVPADN